MHGCFEETPSRTLPAGGRDEFLATFVDTGV
jgi:hypothetical protein